jgi:tRNA 2-thiouridine synthesizing protein A
MSRGDCSAGVGLRCAAFRGTGALDRGAADSPLGRLTKTRMADTVLNLRGLRCPLPALKTRKALTRLAAGDRLVVECTDPLSAIDIPNLLRETGDVLEGDARETGVFVFRIRKANRE